MHHHACQTWQYTLIIIWAPRRQRWGNQVFKASLNYTVKFWLKKKKSPTVAHDKETSWLFLCTSRQCVLIGISNKQENSFSRMLFHLRMHLFFKTLKVGVAGSPFLVCTGPRVQSFAPSGEKKEEKAEVRGQTSHFRGPAVGVGTPYLEVQVYIRVLRNRTRCKCGSVAHHLPQGVWVLSCFTLWE